MIQASELRMIEPSLGKPLSYRSRFRPYLYTKSEKLMFSYVEKVSKNNPDGKTMIKRVNAMILQRFFIKRHNKSKRHVFNPSMINF